MLTSPFGKPARLFQKGFLRSGLNFGFNLEFDFFLENAGLWLHLVWSEEQEMSSVQVKILDVMFDITTRGIYSFVVMVIITTDSLHLFCYVQEWEYAF